MRRTIKFLFAMILLATVSTAASGGQASQSSTSSNQQIIFLHFHADSNGISFVNATAVTGALKAHRAESESGDIYYEIESAGGTVLSSGSLNDPLQKKLEYEDPDSVGVIRSTFVRLDEADFVLRVRYDSEIDAISFYRTQNADGERVADRSSRIARTKIAFGNKADR